MGPVIGTQGLPAGADRLALARAVAVTKADERCIATGILDCTLFVSKGSVLLAHHVKKAGRQPALKAFC